jgi:hypothetical protein
LFISHDIDGAQAGGWPSVPPVHSMGQACACTVSQCPVLQVAYAMQWAGLPGGRLRVVRGDVPDAAHPAQMNVATRDKSRILSILLY